MKPLLLMFIFIVVQLSMHAQDLPQRAQQQLESLAEALEADPEDDQWLQQMEQYRRHPLNLNKASAEDLRSLRLLNDLQIYHLLQHRKLLGTFLSVYELQAVPGWPVELIQRLLPYIKVEEEVPLAETLLKRIKGGNHMVLLSASRVLERQKGYVSSTSSGYLGGKERLQARYRYQYKNLLQWGVTADKDPGEPFWGGSRGRGFDFYSVHLFARQLGAVKALALGDYTVNLGQGLVHWQSLAFGKSAEVINIKRQGPVLQPYSSAGEFYFNRGAGLTVQQGSLELTAFASHRVLSGNRVVDTLLGEELVSSIQPSGYHRTINEQEDRNHLGFTALGGSVAWRRPGFQLALNAVQHELSKPLRKREEPYNLFAINGKHWANYSIDYSATYRNLHLFGEGAVDIGGHKALVQGVLMSLHAKVDASLLYRNISRGYQAFSARAFTESAQPSNEEGLYMGLSVRPSAHYKIDAYADFYRTPWLKFRVDAPGRGRDYSLQVTYTPSKQLEVYARYRYEVKTQNAQGVDSLFNITSAQPRQNARLHLEYAFTQSFTLRARTEYVRFGKREEGKETGFSAYAESIVKRSSRLSANLRVHYFATDSYNSRIYAYESDLLYHYYIPTFYDRGFRYYLRLNWDIGQRLSCWLRLGQTLYVSRETIGSGLDEIDGNQKTEAAIQVRLSL